MNRRTNEQMLRSVLLFFCSSILQLWLSKSGLAKRQNTPMSAGRLWPWPMASTSWKVFI